MTNRVLTPAWGAGHSAAMRGEVMEEQNRFSGDEGHEFQIGFECGLWDLRTKCRLLQSKLPTPEACAQAMGFALEHWPGNCYAVATQMVAARIVQGRAVYGAYLGPIADNTLFANRALHAVNHGWIETPEGLIVDPTRWVFDGTPPSLAVLPPNPRIYDEGASQRARRYRLPFPASTGQADLAVNPVVRKILLQVGVAPPQRLNRAQAAWIANLTVQELGGVASEIYSWLDTHGCGAYVPADNRAQVQAKKALVLEPKPC